MDPVFLFSLSESGNFFEALAYGPVLISIVLSFKPGGTELSSFTLTRGSSHLSWHIRPSN